MGTSKQALEDVVDSINNLMHNMDYMPESHVLDTIYNALDNLKAMAIRELNNIERLGE